MLKSKKTANPKKTANQLARELVDKSGISVAGNGYSVSWLVSEGMKLGERDALLDAVSSGWRKASKRAGKLLDAIKEKPI
jgi:hypothetical protein